jgi:GntR family transcriptional regulator
MLDGMPIAVDRNCVPLRLIERGPELDFTTVSLYDTLDAAGHAPVRADYDIEARAASAEQAELLDISPGAPVLVTTTVAMADDGQVVDAGRTVYRADRYRFQATLVRRPHRERETDHETSLAQRHGAGRAGVRRRRVRRDAGAGQARAVDD